MTGSKQIIRVLVVDDHPVVRKGLQSCLSKREGLRIVGEATDGDEAVQMALKLQPDVVLMDFSLPRLNGLAATEMIRREVPQAKVLVLSIYTNRDYILRIVQAGAHGYISKQASPEELMRGIECVHAGKAFFPPEIAQAALEHFLQNGGKQPVGQLTDREREVLTLIAEGQSNKEIASRLHLGVRTIETYRESIMRRLDIHSVAGLTRFAIVNGLSSLGSYTDQP